MTGAAMQRQELSAAEAFAVIEAHRVALIPCLDLWQASTDVLGEKHNRKRALSSLSATDSTSLGAVSKLARLLEQEQQPLNFDGGKK